MVVEKPFGHDLASRRCELNRAGRRRCSPRRTSSGSTTTWARRRSRTSWRCGSPTRCSSRCGTRSYVDSVQITMAEDVGIGGRAGFYDSDRRRPRRAAEPPAAAARADRDGGAGRVRPPRRSAPRRRKVLQRDRAARRHRPVRRPRSVRPGLAGRASGRVGLPRRRRTSRRTPPPRRTPRSRLGVETRRWAGVPFYLRTGKRLPRRVTEIAIAVQARRRTCRSTPTDTEELGHNQLVIRVQPDEGVTLKFGSKVPGTAMEVRDVTMDFPYGEAFTESSAGGLRAADPGRAARRRHAVPDATRRSRPSWRVIDPLEAFWAGTGAAPVPGRRVGPAGRRRDAGPRRPHLASAMKSATTWSRIRS